MSTNTRRAPVIVDVRMSPDGYIAGPNDGPDNGLGNGVALFSEGGAPMHFKKLRCMDTRGATHLWYGVVRKEKQE